MTDAPTAPKPKKSVALSGVAAGNTALCTVGRTGNDLAYRGYDILDIAEACEFEEIAYLLVHGKLPTRAELAAYKAHLKSLRGLPEPVKEILERVPAAAHPMDVLRTGVSALGSGAAREGGPRRARRARRADRLLASQGSMLLYWYHWSHNGKRIDVETDDDSIGGHFLHLLHGRAPKPSWVRAMHTSLILYAEHEFNASTFAARVIAGTGSDFYSCIAGAIGALRGPKHGGANEFSFETQKRYDSPDDAEADIRRRIDEQGSDHRLRPSRLHDRRPAQQGDQGAGAEPVAGRRQPQDVRHRGADRDGHDGREEDVREPRLVLRGLISHDGRAHGDVHAALRRSRASPAGRRTSSSSGSTARSSGRPPTTSGRTTRRSSRSISASRPQSETASRHVRPDQQRPPQARPRPHRHRRLRDEVQDHEQGGVRHRAPLPDRHAGLRLRGAFLPGLHQAHGPDRSRHGRAATAPRCRARRSSSTRCRRRSTSAR